MEDKEKFQLLTKVREAQAALATPEIRAIEAGTVRLTAAELGPVAYPPQLTARINQVLQGRVASLESTLNAAGITERLPPRVPVAAVRPAAPQPAPAPAPPVRPAPARPVPARPLPRPVPPRR
jgi:hypothetical protein